MVNVNFKTGISGMKAVRSAQKSVQENVIAQHLQYRCGWDADREVEIPIFLLKKAKLSPHARSH